MLANLLPLGLCNAPVSIVAELNPAPYNPNVDNNVTVGTTTLSASSSTAVTSSTPASTVASAVVCNTGPTVPMAMGVCDIPIIRYSVGVLVTLGFKTGDGTETSHASRSTSTPEGAKADGKPGMTEGTKEEEGTKDVSLQVELVLS